MSKDFEIWLGRRVVSRRRAPNAHEAVIDYVRALGCPRDQLTYLGVDAIGWHGAVYRATAAEAPADAPRAAA